MTYLARWPDYFHAAVNPVGRVMGYSMSLVRRTFSCFFERLVGLACQPLRLACWIA
jgi:hypothetical protein